MKRLAVAICAAALFAGCGEKGGGAAAADKPKSGIAAMTDEDRAFYASSFTTLATVPYGRCWPESLVSILGAGRKLGGEIRFVEFAAPKRFKQNEGFPEWMRVKSVVVERKTRRVVSAKGRAGPFDDDAAVQAYLDSEVRPDLNSQFLVEKVESPAAKGEMRFSCSSKYCESFTLRIVLREAADGKLWLDAIAEHR